MKIGESKYNSRADLPRISIVTPSFNQGELVEETIRSILLQDYPNLQYIVIDGGSSDNSVEIIKKYATRIDYWVSEKDRGQSHAINKGIARCTGEIFNWINSDDLLMPGALWAVAEAWNHKPDCIVAGGTELFNEAGTFEVVEAKGQTLTNFVRFWEAQDFGWCQQSTFIPLKELRAIGGVREDLHFVMDYHMMVKLLMRGLPVSYLHRTLSRFRFHAVSKTVALKEDFRLQRVPALRSIENLPVAVEDWEWDAEQARRFVDVARHAWRQGGYGRAVRLFGRGLETNAAGAISETWRRLTEMLRRRMTSPVCRSEHGESLL